VSWSSLHPWRSSKATWKWSWAASSKQPCLTRGLGQDELQSSLPSSGALPQQTRGESSFPDSPWRSPVRALPWHPGGTQGSRCALPGCPLPGWEEAPENPVMSLTGPRPHWSSAAAGSVPAPLVQGPSESTACKLSQDCGPPPAVLLLCRASAGRGALGPSRRLCCGC